MKKHIIIILFLVVVSICKAQNFTVQNDKILDPTGQEFIIKGTNVNGPHWPWNRPTIPDADLIINTWKFNTVRVNCVPSLKNTFPNNNPNFEAIVSAFTPRRVVVQLENHDFTGKYPEGAELENLKTWWIDLANRFKSNPYVWFNIMNEPGNGPKVDERWKTTHETIVKAIRATGANNIIVLDEHGFGQASGLRDGTTNSGILTYAEYFTKNYQNICFSVHMYSEWIYGQNRLAKLFEEAKNRKFSVHIGEYGSSNGYAKSIAAQMFSLLLKWKVGNIVWHWDGTDAHALTQNTARGGAWEIDPKDGTIPRNLSFVGNLIWKYNRDELKPNSPDFELKALWMLNGSFEKNFDEWINWGNAEVEKNSTNAKDGNNNVKVASAAAGGGCGQPIYLTPGETYVVQAWGKNSIVPTGTTDLGVQYKDASGKTQFEVLNFTETNYVQKRKEFTLPQGISDVSIFIWKNDKNVSFFADNIELFLKKEEVILANSLLEDVQIEVYPNPTTGIIVLKGNDLQQFDFHVTNLAGQEISVKVVHISTDKVQIQLPELPDATYFISGNAKGQRFVRKVLMRK